MYMWYTLLFKVKNKGSSEILFLIIIPFIFFYIDVVSLESLKFFVIVCFFIEVEEIIAKI